jgi:hypothetical protein
MTKQRLALFVGIITLFALLGCGTSSKQVDSGPGGADALVADGGTGDRTPPAEDGGPPPSDGQPPADRSPPDGSLPPAPKTINAASLAQFASLAEAALTKMRQGQVFFGHQSVGQNILSGLEALGNQDGRYRLNIEEVSGPGDYGRPMLGHAPVEENGDPKRKIDSFKAFLTGGIGNQVQAAYFKFCYVDFGPDSDVNGIFAKYKSTMASLRQSYPGVLFAHITVPLETSGAEYNAKRHAMSDLLRQEYGGRDFILDLADIESDGTRCKQGGSPKLCDAYSSDGGHLNDTGAERAAKGMVMLLAGMLGGG